LKKELKRANDHILLLSKLTGSVPKSFGKQLYNNLEDEDFDSGGEDPLLQNSFKEDSK
jgi:hypothetical protein